MNYGDLFWVNFPDTGGREQRGRRPAVIWQDTARFTLPTVVVIPLTTGQANLRFPCTHLIRPSATNALRAPSVALVFQLVATDVSRVETRIGEVEAHDLARLQDLAKSLQRLP
jgi:mRNA-degrading endonuclease toxin of MazEF toxin-antitoxin module